MFLAVDGEPHRSLGNLAFVRIWQGKALLVSVLLPYFVYLSLEFFQNPAAKRWRRLFVLLVASTGVSSTALYLMPSLALLLAISAWNQSPRKLSQYVRVALAYFSTHVYLVLLGLFAMVSVDRSYLSVIGQVGWPTDFMGQFRLVFIDWMSFSFVALTIFAVFGLSAAAAKDRLFVLTWLVVAIVLFLNPIVFPLIVHFTTLNTYWRLAYLLPFPLLVGLPIVLLDRVSPANAGSAAYACAAMLIVAGVTANLLLPIQSTLVTFRLHCCMTSWIRPRSPMHDRLFLLVRLAQCWPRRYIARLFR